MKKQNRNKKIIRHDGLDFQGGDILNVQEVSYVNGLHKLWDMLSETIESGRLTESDIPEDYQAFVAQMIHLNKLQHEAIRALNLGL